MKLIVLILKIFNQNPIGFAARLLRAEVERECGFSGPIKGATRHLSNAIDCVAAYEEARDAAR